MPPSSTYPKLERWRTTRVLLDVFVVALLIERSFAMFASPLGTWLPFALIVAATWGTGRVVAGQREAGTS